MLASNWWTGALTPVLRKEQIKHYKGKKTKDRQINKIVFKPGKKECHFSKNKKDKRRNSQATKVEKI